MNTLPDRFWDHSPLVLEPTTPVKALIIWLHGLGADGDDFAAVAESLELEGVRHLLPYAPRRPVTVNQGMIMRAWYDIALEGSRWLPNDEELLVSVQAVNHLVDQQLATGLRANKIFLAGFSQGGAVALATGTRHASHLGGVLALSTYLPLIEQLPTAHSPALPIFMAHGRQDPVIDRSHAQRSHQILEAAGYPVTWHEYPIPHSVCLEEIHDMAHWLKPRLKD